MKCVLKDIMAIPMLLASHAHVPKQTRTSLVVATFQSPVYLATAKKGTRARFVIDVQRDSSVIRNIAMDFAKAVTATLKESFPTSATN